MIEINGNVVRNLLNYQPKSYKNLNLLSGSACRYDDGIKNPAPVDVDSEYFKFENIIENPAPVCTMKETGPYPSYTARTRSSWNDEKYAENGPIRYKSIHITNYYKMHP